MVPFILKNYKMPKSSNRTVADDVMMRVIVGMVVIREEVMGR
jgi:hypothetical protein